MIGMKLIVVIFGLAAAVASYEKCCDKKTVGQISYSLVESGGNVPASAGCLNSCVYTQDGDSDKMFCFARGNETVTCQAKDLFDREKCVNYDVTCDLSNVLIDNSNETVTTPAECGTRCQDRLSECNAWTMIPQETTTEKSAKCFFLSSCNKIRPTAGHVSGDYRCPNSTGNLDFCPFFGTTCIDENQVGNVINPSDPVKVTTPNECGEKCNTDNKFGNGCKFWTMIPEVEQPPSSCTLLSKCGTSKRLEGAISGSNNCPPLS